MVFIKQIFFSSLLVISVFTSLSLGMLRSQAHRSPIAVNQISGQLESYPHCQLKNDAQIPVLQSGMSRQFRSGVEFPGAPSQTSTQDQYEQARTTAPYGNQDYFKDIFNTPIGQFHPFTTEQRSLVILYNLIRNHGYLISDYHRGSNRFLNYALKQDGLEEEHLYLRLPQDLIDGRYIQRTFASLMATISTEHLALFNDHLKPQSLTLATLEAWIVQNQDARYPIAHLDHIHPQSKRGSNDFRNAILCSADTNLAKSDHWLVHVNEYLASPPSDFNDLNPISLKHVIRNPHFSDLP